MVGDGSTKVEVVCSLVMGSLSNRNLFAIPKISTTRLLHAQLKRRNDVFERHQNQPYRPLTLNRAQKTNF